MMFFSMLARRVLQCSFVGCCLSLLTGNVLGDVITQWTFEGDTTVASTGTGSASLVGGTSAGFATGNGNPAGRAWNTSTYAAQSAGSGTRGVQFLTSTVGYQDIKLSFDHRASGTASRWAQLDYTLDGGSSWVTGFWNNAGALSPHDTFNTFSNIDFSSVTAANDNALFGVRIVSIFSPQAFDQSSTLAPFAANTAYMRANAGAVYSPLSSTATGDYGTSGTWRFDNVTFDASPTAVPEPSSMALVGLGIAGAAWYRRKRKSASASKIAATDA